MTNEEASPQTASEAPEQEPLGAAEWLERLVAMQEADAATLYGAVAQYEEIAPGLRDAFDRFLDQGDRSDDTDQLVFWGVHIAAAARDTTVFLRVLRLLSLPEAEMYEFWGDAMVGTSTQLIASTFDGDVAALLAFIQSPQVEPLVGNNALLALAFLTWAEKIERATTFEFLHACFEDRAFDPGDPAWTGWAVAIALLGAADMEADVSTAYAEELIEEQLLPRVQWRSLLREAESAPGDITRFTNEGIGYLDDIYAALSWIDGSEMQDEDYDAFYGDEDDEPPPEPLRNPLRNVGRNDPCPCGSGKKFKKCCLT